MHLLLKMVWCHFSFINAGTEAVEFARSRDSSLSALLSSQTGKLGCPLVCKSCDDAGQLISKNI